MTIASEITRLQTDKECIRQAIIGKWVDVAVSVSFDDYASCISAIKQWLLVYKIKYLLVWGWGGGYKRGGWGWAVCFGECLLTEDSVTVTIWNWGNGNGNWGATCLGELIAPWGCAGGSSWGASGGWYSGWGNSTCSYWGWAWAWGNGWGWGNRTGWKWGAWICWFGWWGWGWGYNSWGSGCDGWGNWNTSGGNNATGCGWGWGWGYFNDSWGKGCKGLAIVCYKTDWSDGINCATWGTVTTSWNYTVHTFTESGTFEVIS